MDTRKEKTELVRLLQKQVDALQGLGKLPRHESKTVSAPFEAAFPSGIFPMGTIHEFVSYELADAASTTGFMSALISTFTTPGGILLWIGSNRNIFPSGLKFFGIEPDHVIFVDLQRNKDILWAIEESLKCDSLVAVIGEVSELSFTESRRLQLAVEQSGVTGFIHRYRPKAENAVACTARWKVSSLPGFAPDGLPGVGHAMWDIQLLKVKNGRPNSWQIGWQNGKFTAAEQHATEVLPIIQKAI